MNEGQNVKIINIDSISKVKAKMDGAENVFKQVPIASADGSPTFSFRVFSIESNGHTPYHTHPFEHLNYVIEGEGCLVTESGEKKNLRKGDFALVLPNEKHQYRNSSNSETMVMICAVPKEYE